MNLCKPKPKINLTGGSCAAGRRGFSAIEVTAVSAIIFVLALILLPIVNKRVDDAKITAAQEDLVAIEKAQQLAYGYTSHFYRLCDLTRPTVDDPASDTLKEYKVPPAYWNKPVKMQTERNYLVKNWRGPLIPKLHRDRSATLAELVAARPELINSTGLPSSVSAVTVGGGPIFLFADSSLPADDDRDWAQPTGGAFASRDYPLDPWGNPYIFFGQGKYGVEAGELAGDMKELNKQFSFTNAAVYSLGPDGIAGNNSLYNGRAPVAADYFREGNSSDAPEFQIKLGKGDDLVREF